VRARRVGMRRLGMALTVALLVFAAACGSSSKSGGGSSGSTLSKADFISKGEAICKDASTKAPQTVPSETDAKAIATWLGSSITVLSDARSQFGALKAPSDATQLQKDFLASIDTITNAMKSAKTKADAGDASGAVSALSGVDDTDATAKKMDAYGFKECGSSSGE